MTSTDIVLGLIIGGAFLLGFFWGVIRSLLMFGAWFVVSVPTGLAVGRLLRRNRPPIPVGTREVEAERDAPPAIA